MCPDIAQRECSDFIRSVMERRSEVRIPWSVSLELTARCNLRCVHCYINLPANDAQALKRELTAGEIRRLIDGMVDEGTLWLLFTGGEPLLRPDFAEIYTYAKTKGLFTNLFTNGTLLTPATADLLAEYPPRSVEITLYGATESTYESVTNRPGSYAKCIRGIEMLLERGINVELKTMAISLNKHEISDMKDYAESLGLRFRFDPLINRRVDGGRQPDNFRISPGEVVALDLLHNERVGEFRSFMQGFGDPPADPDRLYDCSAGFSGFHIDPYGSMNLCVMARYRKYDLRRGSVFQGWREFAPRARNETRSKKSPCRTCQLISLCGQCPGWGYLETGDPEAAVEYLCEVAHLRAESFGLTQRGKGD